MFPAATTEKVCSLAGDCDDGGMAQAQKVARKSERKEGKRKQVCDVMGMVQLCADSFVNSPRTPSCLALIDS